ncbi:phosphoribosylformylglycinamidine synthase [Microbacter margulisiae]|uniref:Phosphoribosylformylglycinamidine synthase n=1 Tax=Microbacter margulisiae TaxID=1350067 RepID=A0A7W5DRS4_9PORP|nr:phosphoribosylformylglycinamidine synthase [Microbacter margulisiae]MBB3187887.1 phosphoribosylformylglycinamidine synthase [Microbacter margulisiae]
MILFFQKDDFHPLYAVGASRPLDAEAIQKLKWLFDNAVLLDQQEITGHFVGPRREMITPWSTNAVEITQNMGIDGIFRIEEFAVVREGAAFDPMLQHEYDKLDQELYTILKSPDPIRYIDDIESYNKSEGLALNDDEIAYLNAISKKIGRSLTDSEVFGFSQVNSEHCRHKIFNGKFILDGQEKESSLFQLIKKTSQTNPNHLLSAYHDNVAFNVGPHIEQFAPASNDKPDFFEVKSFDSVISLKAETHNFPTTVEPFNGAATGSGGEIRDRLAGGKASLPLAGTAVYMTSYARNDVAREWEKAIPARKWLYHTPEQILIKASNGASDFGNKFGQPLICGSVLTFEHIEHKKTFGYDKVIMLAGGIGFAKKQDSLKETPKPGQKVIVMGGDNYRIGMGGGAVSSVNTGQYANAIELNAVQRANPEMQKRVANVIRALAEMDHNPVVSIHDHGAGGHLNCLSELIESTGGKIDMEQLPVGDPTLSAKEIIGNESQERMGLLVDEKAIKQIDTISKRERAPLYVVGETTGDMHFVFEQKDGQRPIDLRLDDMFGKPPRTVITDHSVKETYETVKTDANLIQQYIANVLQLENVACKDWLTNKVDRSVTGKVARQQTAGELQLPLNDVGVMALDYRGKTGIATSIGHAPAAALISPEAGSVLSIAEALTNIVWAPLADGLISVSLSANWMWPCKNEGEDVRLYRAVEACSNFACELGVNIPTGKDSLSMTQNYDGQKVFDPGTVIISAAAEVKDIRSIISPVLVNNKNTTLYYIDFSNSPLRLGGSALAQTLNHIGSEAPTVSDAVYFRSAFTAVQSLIQNGLILAGHDVSGGGLLTTLLEMCFANTKGGLSVNLKELQTILCPKESMEASLVTLLFAENPAAVIQVEDKAKVEALLQQYGVRFATIATPEAQRTLIIGNEENLVFDIDYLRDLWYKPSYLLDRRQSGETLALQRYQNYKQIPLSFRFNPGFNGSLDQFSLSYDRKPSGIKAAIMREKGTNGEREMAYALYLAGFDVKDVHATDLASGRETLDDVQFIVFCGGFSNSDVLGSAKGWAGGLLFNPTAKETLDRFYARQDTLSLGICNGCQLMVEMNLVYPEHEKQPTMTHNNSHKFESGFVNVTIPQNESVLFRSLSGSRLGIWVAHGEGKFQFPYTENHYNIVAKYSYSSYPANPNGSDFDTAGICSADGRHLAMMPHLERAIFPWQWAQYPVDRHDNDEVTPWIEAFVNARQWIEKKR